MIFDRLLRPERDFIFAAFRTAESERLFRLFRVDELLAFFAVKNEFRGRNFVLVFGNFRDFAEVGRQNNNFKFYNFIINLNF